MPSALYSPAPNFAGALTYLNLGSAALTAIPSGLSILTGLLSLNLSSNPLTGAMPDLFTELSQLTQLDLSGIDLGGVIALPSSLDVTAVTGLLDLRLANNPNLGARLWQNIYTVVCQCVRGPCAPQ